MRRFFARQWFLIALATVLTVGFAASSLLAPIVGASLLRNLVVASVLFLMALPLETRSVWETICRPWAALLASLLNMAALPFVAWGLTTLLQGDLAIGLMVAASAPCTLASAAVWTRRAGGSDAIAIMVTVLTNLSCFLITPMWLVLSTGTHVQAARFDEMVSKLAILVVVPMVLAQCLRQFRVIGLWAVQRRFALASCAQTGILYMVLVGAVKCGIELSQREWQGELSLADFAMMAVVVIGLHLSVLWGGYALARACRFSRPDGIAIGISGSQKTLMIGLFVAIRYFGGLAILPMVAYHVGQLFVDTLIADYWARQDDRAKQSRDNDAQ